MAVQFLSLPFIPRPWASGGQAQSDIPDDATGTNRASYQEGWGEITSKPIADGGVPPNRLDFNGILEVLSSYAYAMQNGQYVTYNAQVVNKIGGYPAGTILWYVNNNLPQYMVMSLVNNNTNDDLTDTTAWQPISISPLGMAMLGTLANQSAAQIRNIEIVEEEPETGVDGTIYGIIES